MYSIGTKILIKKSNKIHYTILIKKKHFFILLLPYNKKKQTIIRAGQNKKN
jgi:hypothetical protein